MTTKEWNLEILKQISDIISNDNVMKYKIIAYKFVQIRLIILYHDCNKIYDWKDLNLKPETFHTKNFNDKEISEIGKQWREEWEKDQPE